MATVSIDGAKVSIRLTWFERVAGLLRDQHLRRDEITSVEVVEEPRRALRGLRAPGLSVPGGACIGTWRTAGGRMFVCVRGDGPAVRIERRGGRYSTYLVSVEDPGSLVAQLV